MLGDRSLMSSRHQHGFTLIEVVVAFAIFALSIGAIFEVFREAVHTSAQVRERDLAWLTAQSVLSQLSVEQAPWPSEQRGVSGRLRWWIDVQPYPLEVEKRSSWSAYQVKVHVAPLHSPAPVIELDSVELARRRQ
jgi:general secretion pathway protein I